ncbi:MAG: VanW family protein [Oscillospiraceae bacterium]|nr:VanW family protein [Oscillospiraceae bacterium]
MANEHQKRSNTRNAIRSGSDARRGHSNSGKKVTSSTRVAVIISVCIALLAIAVGVVAGCVYLIQSNTTGVILQNVSVAGVNVGGMRQKEAIQAVSKAVSGTYSKLPMQVNVFGRTFEIPANYVGTLDVRAAVKAAYNFGNTGSQNKRQEEQQIAMTTGYVVDLAPYLNLNEDGIRQIIAQHGENFNTTLSQSTYEVVGNDLDRRLIINLGTPEYSYNTNTLYAQVIDAYSRNEFYIEAKCELIEPNEIDLASILKTYYIPPVNAGFDVKTFEVIPSTDGYGFDLSEARDTIAKAQYGSEVIIPFTKISPEITVENLAGTLYRDELAVYTAIYDSDNSRDINLQLACQAINGKILYPGKVFSFNDTLGKITAANGYQPATAFQNGGTAIAVGGGIEQVSSALYYCVLAAELDVLVRINNAYAPSYVPLGFDAAVNWNYADFRFCNNTNYPIRIDAVAIGGAVEVKLIGTDIREYSVELISEEISKKEFSVTYQTMPADNTEGYKDGDYIVEPFNGYTVKTYICKLDKETLEQISKTYIGQTRYEPRNGVICKIDGNSSGNSGNGDIPEAPNP